MEHPALTKNKVAVITGGADGIGLAAAEALLERGMRVCVADVDSDKLEALGKRLPALHRQLCDVSNPAQVDALREAVYLELGRVDVLMNNAAVVTPSTCWSEADAWRQILATNVEGIVNGLQSFLPSMLDQHSPGLIINTGSKQGISNPPGNAAYNASKAAVRSITESLQHELRNTEDCQLSAHLLVPGFTYTGVVQRWIPEKPEEAWEPRQVVDYMLSGLARGDFYILCPDNGTSTELDALRIRWAAGDLTDNRPALSRWHKDFEQDFQDFIAKGLHSS